MSEGDGRVVFMIEVASGIGFGASSVGDGC
jgi:hypothetical protein